MTEWEYYEREEIRVVEGRRYVWVGRNLQLFRPTARYDSLETEWLSGHIFAPGCRRVGTERTPVPICGLEQEI